MLALMFYDYISYIYMSGVVVMLLLSCYAMYLTIKERDKKALIIFFGLVVLVILSWAGLLIAYSSYKKNVKNRAMTAEEAIDKRKQLKSMQKFYMERGFPNIASVYEKEQMKLKREINSGKYK